MMRRKLPPSASVATSDAGAKLHAPAAARNADALRDLLLTHAPSTGRALELASGTGQHVIAFAAALPGLHWQPTEIDADRRASINAHAAETQLPNIAPALALNATRPGWGAAQASHHLILLVNLLHLISAAETKTLITEAAHALAPAGTLILYGPFKRDGALTSEGDAKFDADLKSADPDIGYKDDLDIMRLLDDAGLPLTDTVQMPANNLAFIARKAQT